MIIQRKAFTFYSFIQHTIVLYGSSQPLFTAAVIQHTIVYGSCYSTYIPSVLIQHTYSILIQQAVYLFSKQYPYSAYLFSILTAAVNQHTYSVYGSCYSAYHCVVRQQLFLKTDVCVSLVGICVCTPVADVRACCIHQASLQDTYPCRGKR